MATTSQGIWTPDGTDQFKPPTDLAAMALSIDGLIRSRAGTSSQRLAATTLPVGMLWQDTDATKMLWKKETSGWAPTVSRWSGSTALRNAFTSAPNGFVWFDTDKGHEFLRVKGKWAQNGLRGELTSPATAWTSTFGEVRTRSVSLSVPTTIDPTIERIEISELSTGTGWGWSSVTSVAHSSGGATTVNFRFFQIGNATTQSLTVAWSVVPITS